MNNTPETASAVQPAVDSAAPGPRRPAASINAATVSSTSLGMPKRLAARMAAADGPVAARAASMPAAPPGSAASGPASA